MSSRGFLATVAAGLVLIGMGAWLLAAAVARGSGPAASNTALTNATATNSAISAVSADIGQVYSYSYTDIPAAEASARRVLTGQALAQYATLAPTLSAAVSQRLTVTSSVTQAGVISLSGGVARVLVFLRQSAVRGSGTPNVVKAQLVVTAADSDGRWRIVSIEVPS
jgi:Mce-associated membrane protein